MHACVFSLSVYGIQLLDVSVMRPDVGLIFDFEHNQSVFPSLIEAEMSKINNVLLCLM